MNYLQAVAFVENLGEFSYDFDLTRIINFLEKLGNPQDNIKTIHVAGTNGKGSVCAYISTVLQKAGYKVGLYTSPHLLDIRERIQINREYIPKSVFANFVSNYSPSPIPCPLTYFELLTAMAFWYFERERVDFAVIEVGLGGRLDATNVIKNPLVSVITNISLEHTKYLGNTISKIAKEKAGIIKNNGFVVTGTSGIALQTIKKIAKIKNARVIKPVNQQLCSVVACPRRLRPCLSAGRHKGLHYPVKLRLFGEHQKQNANLAAETCRFLGIPEKHIIDGLQNTVWPARFEIIRSKKQGARSKIILDVAHNPSGVISLKNSIKKYFGKKINPALPEKTFRKGWVNFVFGVLKDKDYKKMIKIISPLVINVFISAPKNERALNPEIVKKEFAKYIPQKNIFVFDSVRSAVKSASSKKENFCITGSVYTVAEAMKSGRW
ncbi:MAG: folylpolyglutamate synthase/dihydrofolate synthase family protein [Elusimicrobiota bacterium]